MPGAPRPGLAACGHGVEPAQIAKTLSLKVRDRTLLVVTCGDARLNNQKVKAAFGGKATMLPADEVALLTGHPVGGVCPFGLATALPVYCDVSLQAFDEVLPAAGSTNNALRASVRRAWPSWSAPTGSMYATGDVADAASGRAPRNRVACRS